MPKGTTENLDVKIGKNINEIRTNRGKTLPVIAELLNVSWQQVQKYEQGINRITASSLYKLAQYFNVNLEEFFNGYNED